MKRREIKIIIRNIEVDKFIINLKKYFPFRLFKEYENRNVNNIYFDTLNFINLNNHIDGFKYRSKTRFRWYGDLRNIDEGNFEIKNKNDLINFKQTFSYKNFNLKKNFKWKELNAELKKNRNVKNILKKYSLPTLINSYTRKYYALKSKKIRLTIDSNLFFFIQSNSLRPNFKISFREKNYSIIEIKFDLKEHQIVKDLLSINKYRLDKFSKYVYGFSYKYFN